MLPKRFRLEHFTRQGYRRNEDAIVAVVERLRRELTRGLHIARDVMLVRTKNHAGGTPSALLVPARKSAGVLALTDRREIV